MKKELPRIEAKKSLGQHFLKNTQVSKLMAQAGNVTVGDTVLEIGPGTGILTRELLNCGAYVVAIEADNRALSVLDDIFENEIASQKLKTIHGDVRKIDLLALGLRLNSYKIIANIPYYISGLLFRLFLEHEIQPSIMVFLVQKEVAERIARSKKESLLSLSVKIFGDPKYIKTVKKGNFDPQPKIDSAVIAISNISKDRLKNVPQDFFFNVLHTGFKSKRKQLIGNLVEIVDREVLIEIFTKLNLLSTVRGEDVPLNLWVSLCKEILIHKDLTPDKQS